jgi:Protein of unknown function (DUF4242)
MPARLLWLEARPESAQLSRMVATLTRLDHIGSCKLAELEISQDNRSLFAAVKDYTQNVRRTLFDCGIGPFELTSVVLVDADPGRTAKQEQAQFLIECRLPPRLTMEAYLARKRQSATIYPFVPEAALLRTYVSADLSKCFLFYNANDVESAKRACRLVGYRVSRLHTLANTTSPSYPSPASQLENPV